MANGLQKVVPKILRPVRQKDILNPKDYLSFDIKVPVAQGQSMGSDFIYNTDLFNDELVLNTRCFPNIINNRHFQIMAKVYNEAGQSLFDNYQDMVSVPRKYLDPPVHVSHYQFTGALGPISQQYMTMVTLHKPLNVTFDSMASLAMFFNQQTLGEQYQMFFHYFSRIPIFCKFNNQYFIANLAAIFNPVWGFITHNNIWNYAAINQIGVFRDHIIKFNNQAYNLNNQRQYKSTEKFNIVYDVAYSDGRFLGVNSPQKNDWYVVGNDNLESSFNNVSPIKCILQMCMLAACYNTNENYTLANGAVFINYTNEHGLKFTGKYFKQCPLNFGTTGLALQHCFNKFKNDATLCATINTEIGWNFANMQFNQFRGTYTITNENNVYPDHFMEDYSAKHLFLCVNGLEDFYRTNFALWLAGIYGHHFDYVLRFFSVSKDLVSLNVEHQIFKFSYRDFDFVQHFGSPLASYCFDFKTEPEVNILLGYNLGNLSKCISNGCVSVSDHVKYDVNYQTRADPVGLFPCVYQNINLMVNASVWRSFKNLLSFMKTRQQRDMVMDHLTIYGRKCFTVLDPYGIFLHFHNETKGLKPADK